jgi:hypothetical protein
LKDLQVWEQEFKHMATTKRRASSSSAVSKTILEQASLTLGKLPEKPKHDVSLREAIQLMQEDIRAALDKGYSHDEVASLMTEHGVEINGPSLKYYLTKYTITRKRGPQTRKRRGAASDEADAASETTDQASSNGASTSKRGRRSTTRSKQK